MSARMMQGDCPKGYRQTEVGAIPEDWEVRSLCNLIDSLEAGVSVNSADKDRDGSVSDLSILKTSCVIDGKFISEECKPIAARDLHRAKLNPRKDTILFSRMNTPALVGECGYVEADYPNLYLPDRLWMSRHDVKRSPHCVRWLAYLLSSKSFNRVIKETATGTSGSMKNISKVSLLAVRIPLPPTKAEQEAIAEALSDADALIESLEQLIAKKRQVKQGAMQELLTGKRRLPGFSGEWEVKRLGEIGSIYGGLTGKTKEDFGEGAGQYITFMNVMTNVVIDSALFERVRVSVNESQNLVARGDLLFNGSSETPEEVAMCSLMASEVPSLFLNSFCFGFHLRDETQTDGLFLAYYIRSTEGRELMKSLAQGSTRYNLSKGALLAASIRLPRKDEQTAVAAILSDMDADIAELEAKLAKARQVKQGMMQELLTGRIRLI